jgi:glycosyltransferase involved in cell wall biosynthesis
MPQVSVIISAYQKANLLPLTLKSVLDQTFQDYEVLVVDDGSTDNTRAVVEDFAARDARITHIYQENQGPGGARNTGIRHAAADLIALLDGDDVWFPEKLAIQVATMEAHPEIDVLFNASHFATGELRETGNFYQHAHILATYTLQDVGAEVFLLADENVAAMMLRKYPFHLSNSLFRTPLWAAAGEFDLRFRGPEDVDFWVRVALTGAQFAYASTPTAIYFKNQTSIAANDSERWWLERRKFAIAAHQAAAYASLRGVTHGLVRQTQRELMLHYFNRAQVGRVWRVFFDSLAYGLDLKALGLALATLVRPISVPLLDRVRRAKQDRTP